MPRRLARKGGMSGGRDEEKLSNISREEENLQGLAGWAAIETK